MKKQKIFLGLILFGLGLIGISSILTMEIPLPAEAEALLKENFSDVQIKLIILINPVIMLTIAVLIGTLLYQRVNLTVPIIEKIVGLKKANDIPSDISKYGIFGGIITGLILVLVGYIFYPYLPLEFKELGESLKPSLPARFLYGGLTEEILMRFGLMTLLVWVTSKITKNKKPITYWIGIGISAIVFALGHFPIAFQAVDNPSISLMAYLLIGNAIGGLIFGWLYWKKGLECAFLAHIFTHLTMIIFEPMLNL